MQLVPTWREQATDSVAQHGSGESLPHSAATGAAGGGGSSRWRAVPGAEDDALVVEDVYYGADDNENGTGRAARRGVADFAGGADVEGARHYRRGHPAL